MLNLIQMLHTIHSQNNQIFQFHYMYVSSIHILNYIPHIL
eukprot:UN07847